MIKELDEIFYIKHRDALGYCVEVDGNRLTEYTPYKAKAEFDKKYLMKKYENVAQEMIDRRDEIIAEEKAKKHHKKIIEETYYNNIFASALSMYK